MTPRFDVGAADAAGAGVAADWEKRATSFGNGAAEVAGEEFSEVPMLARLGSFAVGAAVVELEEFSPGGTGTCAAVEAAVPPAVEPRAGSPGGTVPIAVDDALFCEVLRPGWVEPAAVGPVVVPAFVAPVDPEPPATPRPMTTNVVRVAERRRRS